MFCVLKKIMKIKYLIIQTIQNLNFLLHSFLIYFVFITCAIHMFALLLNGKMMQFVYEKWFT